MENPRPSLVTWQRPHFKSGGGDAFLFYVVYGAVDTAAPVQRSAYRCEGIPDGLEVMSYGPNVHPDVVNGFRDGYLWDELRKTDPELAATVGEQNSCVVMQGTFSDPTTLDYLRNTIGLVTHFLDHGGVAVLDPQMFRWRAPKTWNERIFEPAGPVPRNHTVTLVSEEAGATEWIHTRGLRKFGRPDLSVHGVPASRKDGVVDLCNRFIEFQAFGGIIPEGQQIRMNSLPRGMVCRHRGGLDDPEFNNVHVEIGQEVKGAPA